MSLHSFTHVALRVEDIRVAESFYRELFLLDIAFKEVETAGGWRTVARWVNWEELETAGVRVGLVMLFRDGFRLALEAVDRVTPDGLLSHVGVFADDRELKALGERAETAGCDIALTTGRALIFDDAFGVRWEMNTFPYDDPVSLSTGARTGAWLDIATGVSSPRPAT